MSSEIKVTANDCEDRNTLSAPPETVAAMEMWIKDGSVPIAYLIQQLGDPGQAVSVPP